MMSTTLTNKQDQGHSPAEEVGEILQLNRKPKKKKTNSVTTTQRMQRMLARTNPLSIKKGNLKQMRKELGKNIRVRKNTTKTRIQSVKQTTLGSYQLLASAPARKTWQEMTPDQQRRYRSTVTGIIDNYLTTRKVSTIIPLSRVAPPGISIEEHNRRVEEFLRANPRMRLRNETKGSEALFEQPLTRNEKRARAADQREQFLEGSLQDAYANIERLQNALNALGSKKIHASRVAEMNERLRGITNRITILEGIRSQLREERAREKVQLNENWRKEIETRRAAENRATKKVWAFGEREFLREKEMKGRQQEGEFLERLGGKPIASTPRRAEPIHETPRVDVDQRHRIADLTKQWYSKTAWRRFRKRFYPLHEHDARQYAVEDHNNRVNGQKSPSAWTRFWERRRRNWRVRRK